MQPLHELVFPLENDSLANDAQPEENGQMGVTTGHQVMQLCCIRVEFWYKIFIFTLE